MVDAPPTLWALGAFRSGTSLLHSLLNAHPDIALIYELNLYEQYPRLPAGCPGQDWRARWNHWNQSLERAALPTHDDPTPPANWDAAARQLFAEHAAAQSARYGGEKSPVYLHAAANLLRDRPNDRFLVLWREPADILRSVRHAAAKSRFFKKPLLDAWFFAGMEKMLAAFDQPPATNDRSTLANDPTPHICQLSYHQLTAQPAEALENIWRWLELPGGLVDPENFTPAFNINDPQSLHTPVATGKVHAPPERPEILTPAERQKVARYREHWAAHFDVSGKFAAEPDLLPDAPLSPSEAARDRFAARCFQFYNRQIQRAYLQAPKPWLNAYRRRRG